MILINLLPAELAPKKKQTIKIPFRLILFLIFFIFLVLAIYNLFFYLKIHKQKRLLEAQWEGLKNKYTQASALEKELGSSVQAEIEFYDQYADPPLETAWFMNAVSDLLPTTVWLSSYKFERRGREVQLVLIGYSESSQRDSKLVQIQNFVNELKEQFEKNLTDYLRTPGKVTVLTTVTTSSKKETGSSDVTEFTAILQTEGFEATK